MGGRFRQWTLLAFALAGVANASGPRYVTGPPFFTGAAGVPIGWKQSNLLYYTDPGDLSASINHAAADALVSAAAGVWNVPVARITVSQGGALAEHVSGQDVYLSSSGMVWPTDVASANFASIAVAVVYDADGSVTDTLLGTGSSDPSGCEQTGVTESVDKFSPSGYILHAIIILNGRCTGADPEMQLQMQYQLERVFGRVLGLAWSQTNDNVFTATPLPTADQAQYWPIMHPIDILCGPYSYQCLPNPFALRPDDVAGLVGLYPVAPNGTPPSGKQASLAAANAINGTVSFPTGEGMAGVNVLVRREPRFSGTPQDWIEASAVSGGLFHQAGASPFVAANTTANGSFGTTAAANQGYYSVPYFRVIDPTNQQTEIIFTEPINPLYIGSASVGPYAPGIVAPAGSAPTPFNSLGVSAGHTIVANFPIGDAPSTCGDGTDGTAAAPAAEPATGWWNGVLCGYGHAAYVAATVKAGRSLTVETTALDANGFATTTKAMPVIGLFAPTDAAGGLPSIGVAAAAFNANGLGTTNLHATPFVGGGSGGTLRVGIADQRGDGRPDFAYQARVFYADSVAPATVDPNGGTVTITGTGFRLGNAVLVNGVAATATSWTANTIVLTVPAMTDANAVNGTPVDVEVDDLGTGASTVMTGTLTYGQGDGSNTMQLVSAPSTMTAVGSTAALPFTVQVLASDGVKPVVGDSVIFSTTSGAAQFGACNTALCAVTTDANGIASTPVTPTAAGTVTMLATDGTAKLSASFPAQVQAGSMVLVSAPSGSAPVGIAATTPFAVRVFAADGKTTLAGQPVVFSGTAGSATFGACSLSICSVVTSATGIAKVTVTPTSPGTITLQAVDGVLTQSTSFIATANADVLTLLAVPNAVAYLNKSAGVIDVRLQLSDGVTAVPNMAILLTAPAGIVFGASGTNIATIITAADGTAASSVTGTAVGTYTLQASYGTVAATTSVQVVLNTPTLTILSAPSGTVNVGTTSPVPFTAQLLSAAGKPMGGTAVAIGGTQGQVVMGCGAGACQLGTNQNGTVTTTVTPLLPGAITLSATWLNVSATTSFTAAGGVETLNVLAAPPSAIVQGSAVSMTFEVLSPDGVTPMPGRILQLITTSGTLAVKGCAFGSCKYNLDSSGEITISATAYVPGNVVLLATVDGLTQTISFNVTPSNYSMKLLSGPAMTPLVVGTSSASPFQVEIVQADGVTPVNAQNVTFSLTAGNASIAACPAMPCVVRTYLDGKASTGLVTPLAVGGVTLMATDNGMAQTVSLTAVNPDLMSLVSAPANGSSISLPASQPFAVRVMSADGATPQPGKNVSLALTGVTGTLGACGSARCIVTTDANGMASTTITPKALGTGTVTATEQGSGQTATVAATFTVVPQPDLVALAGGPANVFQGATTTSPFAVKVTLADGVTPASGIAVALNASGVGVAQFAACGAASCNLATDATGTAGSLVTGTQVGPVILTGTAQTPTGNIPVTATLQVIANVETIMASPLQTYIAEAGTATIPLSASLTLNGAPASAQALNWTGSNAFVPASASSIADGNGNTTMSATVGPLTAGTIATATTCAWVTVCGTFTAYSVPGSSMMLAITSGGLQTASGGTALNPVTVQVTDAGQHPVADATVQVGQQAWAADVPCPALGRCPAAALLASSSATLTSDASGAITVTPLVVPGRATMTSMAFSAGTQGFATTQVWSNP